MWIAHQPNSRTEGRGANTAASSGTALTGGSSNVKGSWTDLGSTTGFAYEAITIFAQGGDSGDADALLDVGISDGSNRFIICADLHLAFRGVGPESGVQLYVPVHIPAGAQISARVAGSGASYVVLTTLIGHAAGLGGAPGFSRCVALFTPATSRGIAIDPGGTANTKGAWTEMTASCPEDIGAMFGTIGYNNDIARAAAATALIDIGLGAAASEYVLYPNATLCWGTARDGPTNCPCIPLFACDVPKTTRIAARGACSLNTAGDRTFDLALYGLVK